MVDNVYILGAGASVSAGAPVMKNFLDRADDLLRSGAFGENADAIQDVFKIRNMLGAVYRTSYLDIDNIEHLFGAIEMGRTIGVLGSLSMIDIERARTHLITLIVKTLEHSIVMYSEFEHKYTPSLYVAGKDYYNFAEYLKKDNPNSCVITFNYDLGMDSALEVHMDKIDYGLNEQDEEGFKYYKLHGSTNWLRDKTTNDISVIPLIPVFRNLDHLENIGHNIFPNRRLNTGGRLLLSELYTKEIFRIRKDVFKGPKEFDPIPVIIPPSWNKNEYQGTLTNVWHKAAKALSQARNIHIIGYSLPESDSFFRYLFALGTMENSMIRNIVVYDPSDPATSGLYKRVKSIIGAGVRDRFTFKVGTFTDAIQEYKNPQFKVGTYSQT